MSRFYPKLTCFGDRLPVRNRGASLVDMIPTSFKREVFGPKGAGGVDVPLPVVFESPSKEGEQNPPLRFRNYALRRVDNS